MNAPPTPKNPETTPPTIPTTVTQPQDFDTWAQMGNRGWSYTEILPFFKRMESYAGVRIGFGQYPGQAGKSQALQLVRALLCSSTAGLAS